MTLGSCRHYGMGPGPIPWTATRHYAEANGVLAIERFEYLIERMDGAFLRALKDRKGSRA